MDRSTTDSSTDSGTGAATTDSTASGLDAAGLPVDIAAAGAAVPANVATLTDTGAIAPVTDGTQPAAQDTVKTLGFSFHEHGGMLREILRRLDAA